MAFRELTGRPQEARWAALKFLREALDSPGEGEAIYLVPDQYTLQAELDVMRELDLPGTFRLQVLSPHRLYRRVFEQAGGPREVLIDEQGRVMLMHAAAQKHAGALKWYKGALGRPGFAERCVAQISAFKQAGLKPEELRRLAQEAGEGALSMKLNDLAQLYAAYEASLAGRYMDGEDQAARAGERMKDAHFLRGARLCVYGFDLISPTLRSTLLALGGIVEEVGLALVLPEARARDSSLFQPVRQSLKRLREEAERHGLCWIERDEPRSGGRSGALGHLERELFCAPQAAFAGKSSQVQMAFCKNPQEEAEFTAALVRELARKRGWRYRDFAVALAAGAEGSADALKRAFRLYGIPLFLTDGRSADRHPLCVFLLSALRAVTRGWALGDMVECIRSGFTGLTPDEEDILVNYAQSRGLRGRAWRAPLARGNQEEIEAAEPLRERVASPLMRLMERAKAAKTTEDTLGAVFLLLEEVDACGRIERQRQNLEAEGLGVWAMEGAQVWNRVVEALDQMAELLRDERLKLRSVSELLRRALSAAQVKALPQSADAVQGGALEHLRAKPVKALLVVGATDAGSDAPGALLGDEELDQMRVSGHDLGMNAEQRQRMRRIGLKSLISMTGSYLMISRPQSDEAGRALESGALMNETSRLLPGVETRGGVEGDQGMLRIRMSQPDAALCRLPGIARQQEKNPLAQATLAALEGIEGMEEPLNKMRESFEHKVYSEKLDGPLAKKLLYPSDYVSASRLERFAACPFRHFAHYALRPEEFRPFELSPRDAGTFYHSALELFVRENGEALGTLAAGEGERRMDQITDQLIGEVLKSRAGEGALAAAEGERMKRVARRAASIIVRQFDGSRFRPTSVELGIEKGEVWVNARAALAGRIDRVDVWEGESEKYLRVIDYKTGGRTVSLKEIYYGLQLQLILYLAAAVGQLGAKPAGVFYFEVADPLLDTEERDPEIVEMEREKRLRLDGLVLRDENVVRAMAENPERAVKVGFKRDGTLRASDRLLESGDFSRLIGHAVRLAGQMLSSMKEGETAISPAESGGRTACRYCEYRTICGFDERLSGARMRRLKSLSPREVLDALRQRESDES